MTAPVRRSCDCGAAHRRGRPDGRPCDPHCGTVTYVDRARPASWPDYAGLVSWRRARSTGTQIGVYRSAEAGFDDDPNNPWSTVCEPHAGFCSHPTRAVAIWHSSQPESWCPTCQEQQLEVGE